MQIGARVEGAVLTALIKCRAELSTQGGLAAISQLRVLSDCEGCMRCPRYKVHVAKTD